MHKLNKNDHEHRIEIVDDVELPFVCCFGDSKHNEAAAGKAIVTSENENIEERTKQ